MSAISPTGQPAPPEHSPNNIEPFPCALTTDIRDLEPNERVRYWSTFESTTAAPSPSIITSEIADDVAAVFAGSKPAVVVSSEELDNPAVRQIFASDKERYGALSKAGARDYYGGQKYFIGIEDNVKKLAELYYDRGGKDSPKPADEHFHRSVGEALGYAPEAIESFVDRISKSRQQASRKGRVGRVLSKLSLSRYAN